MLTNNPCVCFVFLLVFSLDSQKYCNDIVEYAIILALERKLEEQDNKHIQLTKQDIEESMIQIQNEMQQFQRNQRIIHFFHFI